LGRISRKSSKEFRCRSFLGRVGQASEFGGVVLQLQFQRGGNAVAESDQAI
jgi:hypothetical protein